MMLVLSRIPIYGSCPECKLTFSNILQYNKHSCAHVIKRSEVFAHIVKCVRWSFLPGSGMFILSKDITNTNNTYISLQF